MIGAIRIGRWLALACAVASAAALPDAVQSAAAGQRSVVCVTFALPAVASSAGVAGLSPVRGSTAPSVVPSVVPPPGSVAPFNTVPPIMVLAPHPATGSYVVPVTTTMPSVPGVALTRPEVLIPPVSVPGQSHSVVAAGLVQSALGPTGGAGATTPLVVCY
jgi:hypothetical protein